MPIRPKHNQPPDGEVVYRRMGANEDSGAVREPRLDPTLLPLVAGFALLLLLILLLGNLSVLRLEDTSRQALDLEQQLPPPPPLLLHLPLPLTKLDTHTRPK